VVGSLSFYLLLDSLRIHQLTTGSSSSLNYSQAWSQELADVFNHLASMPSYHWFRCVRPLEPLSPAAELVLEAPGSTVEFGPSMLETDEHGELAAVKPEELGELEELPEQDKVRCQESD
jgi:hypothetical protein